MTLPRVPCSDAAGRVLAVGKKVTKFSRGDKVATLFSQEHQYGPLTEEIMNSGVGGTIDGTLRKYAVFPDYGLVQVPSNLSQLEASTLTCAPLTAWNGLYGVLSSSLKAGDTILTQGTGGVSLAAIQFALAAGANVIATTSSESKSQKLRELGVKHIINYRNNPNWGEQAKALTRGNRGVDQIIEVGGADTLEQSLKAIRKEGLITIIGFLTGLKSQAQPKILDVFAQMCQVRGILVGSKEQFEDMNRAIEANNIHPVIDSNVFKFEQAREAFQYQWDQKHFGKVVIEF